MIAFAELLGLQAQQYIIAVHEVQPKRGAGQLNYPSIHSTRKISPRAFGVQPEGSMVVKDTPVSLGGGVDKRECGMGRGEECLGNNLWHG